MFAGDVFKMSAKASKFSGGPPIQSVRIPL
jgi:hypothetical protein